MPSFRSSRLSRRRITALAAAGLLTRCAAVPHISLLAEHDIGLPGHQPAKPPPLSNTDALQQQYELQRDLSQAPIVFGNQVTLLPSGAATFAALFQAMRGARDSINLEYFIFADITSGNEHLSDVLVSRLGAGVRVNIVYDAFGSRGTSPALFATLLQAGAKIVEFNPLDPFLIHKQWEPNDRDHRKIAVIDGHIGFTGGVNLDPAYNNPPSAGVPADGNTRRAYWRDTAVRIEGPAVAELQKLFFGTWREQKGPTVDPANYFPPLPRLGVQTIRIIGSAPGDQKPLYYASLLTAIGNARRRIWLSSGYFVPPHQEREALAKASREGLDVRIVTPAFSDVQSAVYAARASYGDLLEAGAHIFEMDDAVVHAKLAVVDDTWTVVGSSNLDHRSVVFNNEVDAVILGNETASQVEAILRSYMETSQEVQLAAWEHRSLRERLQEMEARAWQYWM